MGTQLIAPEITSHLNSGDDPGPVTVQLIDTWIPQIDEDLSQIRPARSSLGRKPGENAFWTRRLGVFTVGALTTEAMDVPLDEYRVSRESFLDLAIDLLHQARLTMETPVRARIDSNPELEVENAGECLAVR